MKLVTFIRKGGATEEIGVLKEDRVVPAKDLGLSFETMNDLIVKAGPEELAVLREAGAAGLAREDVTLLAPRRYGKTGLIRNAFHRAPDDWTTVYADVYATADLREFTQVLANAVAGSLDTVAEKAVSAAAKKPPASTISRMMRYDRGSGSSIGADVLLTMMPVRTGVVSASYHTDHGSVKYLAF